LEDYLRVICYGLRQYAEFSRILTISDKMLT